jgi:preprotein translocase subunit SecD
MNRYPLWRYILLAVLIILGILYALPNLYGEDYAVQVQLKSGTQPTAQLNSQITEALKTAQIPYKSITTQAYAYLIRFSEAENQLKAQDVLQATLGPDFTVALNLADKTPQWLLDIGAKPMKLGLDLRGGIHFLIEVDTATMMKDQQSSDLHNMAGTLRDKQIRYSGLTLDPANNIAIQFRDAATRDAAIQALKKDYPDYQIKSAEQGFEVNAAITPQALIRANEYAISQNITILNNRVNELGVAEPVIQQQGKNQISVDLPGIQDTARAKSIIGKVATVRFQLVDVEHDAVTASKTGTVPIGSGLYKFEGQPYLLKDQIVLHGSSILHATAATDENGRPAVSIRAGGSEVGSFNRVTRANINKPMATVYVETQVVKKMVNGEMVSQPRQVATIINIANINSALGAQFQIMGLSSPREAQDLALQLRSGAYSAPLAFVQERLIGPSLGKENIRQGINSMVVALAVVVVFMALYYHLFGIFADLALVLNTIFIVAVMSLLGATLTLPGIAGMVLTIGMAVDANVLINERIREELRNGMSPQASIHAGYERAFNTIVDSNVTTLIVAVILFALGTGPVQSFAITLSIGIISSMITAVFFTRALVNLTYGWRSVKKLSIGIRLPSRKELRS